MTNHVRIVFLAMIIVLTGGGLALAVDRETDVPRLVLQAGHSDQINCAAVSRDGTLLSTGAADATIRLWHLSSGAELRTLRGHRVSVDDVAFTADGKKIVSTGGDFTVRTWDVATGRQVTQRDFSKKMDPPRLRLSPQGTSVALFGFGAGDPLFVVDVATGGEALLKLPQKTGSIFPDATVSDLAFSADERLVICCIRYSGATPPVICTFELSTGKLLAEFTCDLAGKKSGIAGYNLLTSFALARDARYVAVLGPADYSHTYGQQVARIWSLPSGKMVRTIDAGSLSPTKNRFPVAFGNTGDTLLISNGVSTNEYSIDSGERVRTIPAPLVTIAGAPHSLYMLTSAKQGKTIEVRDMATASILSECGSRFGSTGLVNSRAYFSPDDNYLISGRIWTINASTASPLADLESSPGVMTLHPAPEGRFLFVERYLDDNGDRVLGLVDIVDTKTGSRIKRFQQALWFGYDHVSPDGNLRVTQESDGKLMFLPVGQDLPAVSAEGNLPSIQAIAFSPDSSTVLAGGGTDEGILDQRRVSSVLGLWEVRTGRLIKSLQGHTEPVSAVAYASRGDHLASGDWSGSIIIRNAESGAKLRELTGNNFDGSIEVLTFSPDGSLLLAGSYSGKLQLWDVKKGKAVREFVGHGSRIVSAAFSADGTRIVSVAEQEPVTLWSVRTGTWLAQLTYYHDDIGWQWLVVDPEGRFEASHPERLKAVHWVMPYYTPAPVELFMRDYYEPRLLARIMAGERFLPVRPLMSLNRSQPKIIIEKITPESSPPGTVEITVTITEADRNEGNNMVRDLRLFRNDQLVAWKDDNVNPGSLVFRGVKLPTALGDDDQVTFSAHAFNSDRIKSATARTDYKLATHAKPPSRRAFIINVGANAYENPSLDLQFAAVDARAIHDRLVARLKAGGRYAEVVDVMLISDAEVTGGVRTITPNNATKGAIRAVIDRLAGRNVPAAQLAAIPGAGRLQPATPDDLVVFSFSGHGFADGKGNFFQITSDSGPMKGKHPDLSRTVSSEELTDWLRGVDAGSFAYILDACHSAAAVEGGGFKPGPMGSRGLGQLAYDKGMRILAATQADDVALEAEALQHGMLTYALVQEGLVKGEADFKPHDGIITLDEFMNFGVKRVPELYAEIRDGNLEKGIKGIKVRLKDIDSATVKKRQDFQQPSLFDFTRGRSEVILGFVNKQ